MTKNLLTARDIHGPYMQLLVNLQGENGQEWLDALKVFLKKANPWEVHYINLAVKPFIPSGWTVEEHRRPVGKKNTHFVWDASKVKLHLDPSQTDLKHIKCHELYTKLKGEPVLNANVLDYLLTHQGLIPDSWKRKSVFFWGTIYRNEVGGLYVRFICWGGEKWVGSYAFFYDDCRDDDPALLCME